MLRIGIVLNNINRKLLNRKKIHINRKRKTKKKENTIFPAPEAQDWEDKELIVVETYTHTPSAFLQQKASDEKENNTTDISDISRITLQKEITR